jgi:hypothetical protein
LNNKDVQLDLGVPLNFSGYAVAVDQGEFIKSDSENWY